jgi:O-antigen/teichoic acid export membrane protein
MATLATGSIAARVIGLAAIPILTRIYSPEDFGTLAVFSSLVALLTPFFTMRYVLALPLPRRDGMAINLFVLCSGLLLCMSLITALLILKYGEDLLAVASMELLVPYIWLILLALIGGSSYEIMTSWALRKQAYKPIATTTVVQGLVGNFVKLLLGFLAIKPLGLLIGHVISTCGGTFALSRQFKLDFIKNWHFVSFSKVKWVACRYKSFPIYRLPSQVLLGFSTQAPLLFFVAIYGAYDTGQLSIALTAIALPLSILGQGVSSAFYAETAKIGIKYPDQLIEITKAVTMKLFIFSIAPALVLFFGGEYIFSIVLGENWKLGGFFASTLSIYLVAQFVTAPVMNIFNILEKQGVYLVINIIRSILMALIFLVFANLFGLDSQQIILLYSISMSLFYFGIYAFLVYELKKLKRTA